MKKVFALLAAVIAAGAVAYGAPASARAGHDNVVAVTNWKDDSYKYRFSLKITRVNGEVVDESNAAVAAASCSRCETVAVAFQVLLVMSDPDVVTPTNLAIAVNENCDSCQTLASAYQWVIATGGRLRLTHDGIRQVNEIRHDLHDLKHVEMSIFDLQARISDLAAQLQNVLATELVAEEHK
jgi:hypothetical protein